MSDICLVAFKLVGIIHLEIFLDGSLCCLIFVLHMVLQCHYSGRQNLYYSSFHKVHQFQHCSLHQPSYLFPRQQAYPVLICQTCQWASFSWWQPFHSHLSKYKYRLCNCDLLLSCAIKKITIFTGYHCRCYWYCYSALCWSQQSLISNYEIN